MKRLYENIEDIHIKGDISQLSTVVTAMDIALQNLADNTEKLYTYLVKYSSSNKGNQFEKVVNTSMALRDELFVASESLNDMQNQVVAYQNKVYRYEDISASAPAPNRYLVNRNHNISVDTSQVQFTRNDMINVVSTLKNYRERVFHHSQTIVEKKNSIANVWVDSQYKDFSEFIDGVIRNIRDAIKIFDEYVLNLESKIKELE